MDELNSTIQQPTEYNDDDIKTLDWMEHIRRRPGMYIGKLGDGSYADDGIYVLLKEVLAPCVVLQVYLNLVCLL